MGRNSLLAVYESKRDELLQGIETVTSLAMSRDDKKLTDQDKETLDRLKSQLNDVTGDLERVSIQTDLSQQAMDAIARVHRTGDAPPRDFAYKGKGAEGQAIWDVLHRSADESARMRIEQAQLTFKERAAQHLGTTAANTTPTAGGFDGLITDPVVGPIIQTYPTTTPFWTLLSPQDVPGVSFRRPRLVDPDLLTAAGPQAGGKEKGELPSKKWDYASDTLEPTLVGNWVNLSWQAIELVPASLQMVVDHLRLRTALSLESAAVAEAAKTGSKVTLAAGAAAGAVQQAVWDAMALVFKLTGQPATWLAGGPDGLAMLGGKVDLAGRPLFPMIGAANANGTASGFSLVQPFGLSFAVTPAITDTTLYVGNGIALEAYARPLPALQADEPSLYGKQVGVASLVAFYSPVTAEAGAGGTPPAEHNAVVKIAP